MMKLGTIEHPKTAALAKELDCPLLLAVGLLEAIWHFTSRYARDGDVGRFTDEQIAAGCHWDGHHLRLIESLIRTRWLDVDPVHRLVVHDWQDHANNWVQALHSRDRKAVRTQSKDSKDSVLDGKGLSPEKERTTSLPIPSLPIPNLTQPFLTASEADAPAAAVEQKGGAGARKVALQLAGIGEPAASELAASGLTVACIREHADRCRERGVGPGALVENLRAAVKAGKVKGDADAHREFATSTKRSRKGTVERIRADQAAIEKEPPHSGVKNK